ncbi:hypothetical protein [Deinococcus yavapaiensis]|uniref:Uncharacterized protein n=1 Tax=Deinococcus yavapaiensis KR-236 TaxID=694435 RepID=A0A318SEG5_9DEIO|nr:hypothetical protein [Deinococcus yavapaiensis]PYE55491.1 hypothetical protein DES52_103326 [Deinococcus yavapaiensis KR-236]
MQQSNLPNRNDDALRYILALYLLAHEIAAREKDKGQKQKMEAVLKLKREALAELSEPADIYRVQKRLRELSSKLTPAEALRLMVDLAFSNPFSPYELSFSQKVFEDALRDVAPPLTLLGGDAQRAIAERNEALKALAGPNWIPLLYVGGMAIMAALGIFYGPVLVGLVGAGMSGAAAVTSGLAFLGGGSMALGGMGMTGGLWLVSTASAVTGAVAWAGGMTILKVLRHLGPSGALIELAKLVTTFSLLLQRDLLGNAAAKEYITNLEAQLNALEIEIEEEKRLNDKGARRVRDLEATKGIMQRALNRMHACLKKHGTKIEDAA